MCVCFTPNENCHFSSEKRLTLPKRVVDFPRERDKFRNKIMEIVQDFACEAKFLLFSFFSFFNFFIFSFFFVFPFFHFFIFQIFFYTFFDFSSFFHFLFFGHFFICSYFFIFLFFLFNFLFLFLFVGGSNSFFLGLNYVTISLNISLKIQFFGPFRVKKKPLRPLFLFFVPLFPPFFFSRVLSFFLAFSFHFSHFCCSFSSFFF